MIDKRDDSGQVAGAEALFVGIAVVVALSLVSFDAWRVIYWKLRLEQAAMAAARAFVLSSQPALAYAQALQALQASIGPSAAPLEYSIQGSLFRCSLVDVSIKSQLRLLSIPFLGSFPPEVTVGASASQVVFPFRNSAGGARACS
jgi:hypothetical protein